MAPPLLEEWAPVDTPVIGMLHLAPLPGSPGHAGDMAEVRGAMLRDAETLVDGGVDGLLLENFGDTPFPGGRSEPSVVAQVTALATEVRRRFDVPLGINLLRNDGVGALAVAAAAGARFIRVNVLCGARLTEGGVTQGIAAELLRERERLGVRSVRLLADVDVKHSAPLSQLPLEQEAETLVDRGHADGLVVSGGATGEGTALGDVNRVKRAAGDRPVLVGSGARPETAADLAATADGLIVGTAVKEGDVTTRPVDPRRLHRFLRAAREQPSSPP